MKTLEPLKSEAGEAARLEASASINSLSRIGHNNPPSLIDHGKATMADLGNWLDQHPVVQTEEEAREGKAYVDRARLCNKDLEDERRRCVDPLNQQVKEINGTYKLVTEPMARILGEVLIRLDQYAKAEEAKRLEIARIAREAAEQAERLAREAEERERVAREDAAHGVLETDVGKHIADADAVFKEYQKLERQAARAERETHVKIGGGFSRALSQKTKETLEVTDAIAAIRSMGASERIKEAICTSARAYREMTGELPDGVISKLERSI